MASNLIPQLSAQQEAMDNELSVSTMSNHQIMEQILATHVGADENFDVDSLFIVVKGILNSAIFVDNVLNTTQAQLKENAQEAIFNPPLCMLKQLSFEMACKDPDDEVAHKTTISILNKLSSYSWKTKAVLTLAAFALDFGEFWLLDQIHRSDQLAKSVGILKGVPTILQSSWLKTHRKAIDELKNLIKATLEVIECIFKLEKLFKTNVLKDTPKLSIAMESKHAHVYWAIIAIVVCRTRLCCLINDGDKTHELLPIPEELNDTLHFLKKHIEHIEEEIRYQKLVVIMENPAEILVAFEEMSFKPLINAGCTNEEIGIEAVQTKNVFLWFSDLNISDTDISILTSTYEEICNNDRYKIVWIPIEENWTDSKQKKFEMLQPKMPPLYIVHNYSFSLGIKYIKKKWQLKDKPIVVVINSKGIVEHPNALRMITISRSNASPFTTEIEKELSIGQDWFGYLIFDKFSTMVQSMKEENYIFFYGGVDEKCKKQLHEKANPLKIDDKFPMELFSWEKESDSQYLWNILKKANLSDPVRQEVQKLLSYETESGWAILFKGFELLDHGNGTKMLKVLEEFDNWKQIVRENVLENSFKDFKKILQQKEELFNAENCIRDYMSKLIPELLKGMEEGKYIFIYGGNDEERRTQFKELVENLNKDELIKLEANISIELYCVEMGSKDEDDHLQRFLSTRIHETTESGWAVLYKGFELAEYGYGSTILKVLEEFWKWGWHLRSKKRFEIYFKNYHKKVLDNGEDWFGHFMIDCFGEPKVSRWIQEGKYIFICENEKWIKHFTKKVKALANDPVIQNAKNLIECYHLSTKSEREHESWRFWKKLEEFTHKKSDIVKKGYKELTSHKNEYFGWGILCKGYKLKVFGNWSEILKGLEVEEFKKHT